jgi:hypothetical protein
MLIEPMECANGFDALARWLNDVAVLLQSHGTLLQRIMMAWT